VLLTTSSTTLDELAEGLKGAPSPEPATAKDEEGEEHRDKDKSRDAL
jgi:hypothetical protein